MRIDGERFVFTAIWVRLYPSFSTHSFRRHWVIFFRQELSYRNDTTIAIFFAANKNKDNAKAALASSYS